MFATIISLNQNHLYSFYRRGLSPQELYDHPEEYKKYQATKDYGYLDDDSSNNDNDNDPNQFNNDEFDLLSPEEYDTKPDYNHKEHCDLSNPIYDKYSNRNYDTKDSLDHQVQALKQSIRAEEQK